MKILFLFANLFFSCNYSFRLDAFKEAKPLVVELGMGDDDLLEVENSTLIEGSVNWEQSATYELKYYDQVNVNYYTRNVHILSPFDLEKGINILEEVRLSSINDYEYKISDFIRESNNSYYLIGTLCWPEPIELVNLAQEYAFVQYYENDELVYEKIFNESYSYITGLIPSEAGSISYITYIDGANISTKLVELNRQGKIIRSKIFNGSGDEESRHLFYNNKAITLFFTSTSKEAFWYTSQNTERMLIVMQIDVVTWNILRCECIGNNVDNDLLACYYINDNFYCLINSRGTKGNFAKLNANTYNFLLLIIDNNLHLEKYQLISPIYGIPSLVIGEQVFHVLFNTISQGRTKLILIEYDLGLRKQGEQSYEFPEATCKFDYVNSALDASGISLLFFNSYETNNTNSFYGVYTIEDQKLKSLNSFADDFSEFRNVIGYTELSRWYFVGIKENNIVKNEMINIKTTKHRENAHNYFNIPEKYVVVNGRILAQIGTKPYNVNTFGYYNESLNLNCENIEFVFANEYYIPLNFNLRSDEVYDLNTELIFNSRAYLNEEEISSGHIINKEGSYQIVFVGQGNSLSVRNFSIKSLSTLVDYQDPVEEVKVEVSKENQDLNIVVEANNLAYVSSNEDYTPYIIIILFLLVGVGASLLIKKPLRRRK